jgi:hypothetical protein
MGLIFTCKSDENGQTFGLTPTADFIAALFGGLLITCGAGAMGATIGGLVGLIFSIFSQNIWAILVPMIIGAIIGILAFSILALRPIIADIYRENFPKNQGQSSGLHK